MKGLTLALPLALLAILVAGFTVERILLRSSDESFPDVHVGPMHLEPLRRADSGQLLAGRVVDDAGRAVEEAHVFATDGEQPHWGWTEADGTFLLEGLSTSSKAVDLSVVAWGHDPIQQTVNLDRAAADGFVVRLDRTGPIPGLEEARRAGLEGRLRAAVETDYGGLLVVLTPLDAPDRERGGRVPRRARADPDGRFEFPELALGTYSCGILPAWAEGGTWPNLLAVEERRLEHEDQGPIELRLDAGTLAGRLVDGAGDPVAGALVLVEDSGTGGLWPPQSSDALGAFAVPDLPPGTYDVSIRAGEWKLSLPEVAIAPGTVVRPDLPPVQARGDRDP